MSRRNNRSRGSNNNNNNNHNNQEELELKLNLSPAETSDSSPEESPPRSCLSSEESLKYSSSPETTSMVLVGCPRCLMYVMLSDADPRCPKCKSTVLLDFLRNNHHNSGPVASNQRRARN